MKVEVLTFMYNEEFLMPFFLKHYDWVDKIRVILDMDSNDGTLRLLQANPKVEIIPFRFPDMMDDELKVKEINRRYHEIRDCDRVLLVDADEFVFTNKEELKRIGAHVVSVKLFNVYRHRSEKDLDVHKSIKLQRRHGYLDPSYNKPIIVKPKLDILWGVGNHTVLRVQRILRNPPLKIIHAILGQRAIVPTDCGVIGAHWANADPCFCVERRVKDRRDRQSKNNLVRGLTIQHQHITAESVLAECAKHADDSAVF